MIEEQTARDLAAKIKEAAQQQGFSLVGISPVTPPPHESTFAEWVRKGLGGEMAYLERTEALRRDPGKLVPWAVSIVSVGINYYQPLPRTQFEDGTRGWISRYAWGDDYHGIVKRKLDELLARIRRIVPEPLRGGIFVRLRAGARKGICRGLRHRLDR